MVKKKLVIHVDQIEKRFDRLEKKIDDSIDNFARIVLNGFVEQDERFDAMDKRFDAMDKRFDGLEKYVQPHENRIRELEEHLL